MRLETYAVITMAAVFTMQNNTPLERELDGLTETFQEINKEIDKLISVLNELNIEVDKFNRNIEDTLNE